MTGLMTVWRTWHNTWKNRCHIKKLSMDGTEASTLKQYVENIPPSFGDGDAHSILKMLYCHYGEHSCFDTDSIREEFHQLYQQLEGKSLQEMDSVIYTTSLLCRDHESVLWLHPWERFQSYLTTQT